jgi:tetratricopeptide (TPR) repeat protein
MAGIAWLQGKADLAREHAHAALPIADEIGDRLGKADILNSLGAAEWLDGDYPAAKNLIQASLDLQRDLGNNAGEATGLNNLGAMEWLGGNYPKASELFASAYGFNEAINDKQSGAMAVSNRAATEHMQANYFLALELHERSLTIRSAIGDRPGIATSLAAAGVTFAALGRWQPAARALAGGLARGADLQYDFGPNYRGFFAIGMAELDTAVAAGKVASAELAQWKAEGERQTFDELTVAVLEELDRLKAEMAPAAA